MRIGKLMAAIALLSFAGQSAVACASRTTEPKPPGATVPGEPSCIGLPCGSPCQYCPREDPSCANAAVTGQCDVEGNCVRSPARCRVAVPGGETLGSGACAGKLCGARCSVCPPGRADCTPGSWQSACDRFGQCVAAPVQCGPDYNPCEGKACGQSCQRCPETVSDCRRTSVPMECNSAAACVPSPAICAG